MTNRRRSNGILEQSRMAEPKRPLELYGMRTSAPAPVPDTDQCPFREARCVKQRKSDSSKTIGTCIVGAEGKPQLICPVRMRETDQVFTDVTYLLDGEIAEVMVIPEIKLGTLGNVDFLVVGLDRRGGVVDFLGLELQTNDTTGSGPLYDARNDFFAGRLKPSYKYGLNWKMSAKLVLKQTLDKSAVFMSWQKRYVWAMQDTLLDRMRGYADLSGFAQANPASHGVFFHAYEVIPGGHRYKLRLKERVGTDLEGVAQANAAPLTIKDEILDRLQLLLHEQTARQTRGFRFGVSD
jgi:Restriction endonuclease NotI